ncbi:protein FAM186B-like [Rhineura floridana]|uniref:protein FAM186B-like n=1 Tax=Rhineura floridana TaxID=261503 RepID=UPI002AC86A21|nr:protein FAM186B-like [Rhineura floridana]
MDFQKFVAWEKLSTLASKTDAPESSSSSSKSGSASDNQYESDYEAKSKDASLKIEPKISPLIEIPPSVRNVLDKIEMAQLERAKKEVSKKLFRILDNVNRTYERYKKDEGADPEIEKEYYRSQLWEERSRRSRFLDEITDVLDESFYKAQELQMVLESLKSLHEMLRAVEREEKVAPTDDLIEEMEGKILKSINVIDSNVQRLIKIFHPLFEEKTKPRRKSALRSGLFKTWREKIADMPQEGEPLTPERMLEDEPLTFTRTNELNSMMQEMVDSSVFNKAESVGIKYIAGMVANLIKALSLLGKQYRSLKIKSENLAALESRKQDPQIANLQRELRVTLEKKAALEMQVQNVEERCKVLLISNEMMQKELHDANEKAMVVTTKVSLTRAPSSKLLEKTSPDTEKDMKAKKDEKSSTKLHAGIKKMLSAKAEEGESTDEEQHQQKPKAEGSDSEQLQATVSEEPLALLAIKAQDSRIKHGLKKVTSPETVIAHISSQLSQKTSEEKSPEATTIGDITSLEQEPAGKWEPKVSEWKKIRASILKRPKGLTATKSPEGGTQVSEGEPVSVESGPKPTIKQDIKGSPSEVELAQLSKQPVEGAPSPGIQQGKTRMKLRFSMRDTAGKVVEAIREKKVVKFEDDKLTQRPLTAPEIQKKWDGELPDKSSSQITVAEGATESTSETQYVGQMQAQKRPIGRPKEIRGKKAVKHPSRTPAAVPQPRQAEETGDVIHGLGTKLQEIATERGGVLDAETIKSFFEELDMTYQEIMPGEVAESHDISPEEETGSYESIPGDVAESHDTSPGEVARGRPVDKLAKLFTVKRPSLPSSASEQVSRKEKQRVSITEASSGQETSSELQEFQAAILACLEDKLNKLKKSPSGSWKRSLRPQPTHPQAQQLSQAIDKKLDECILMKQKIASGLRRQKFVRSIQDKGELQVEEEKGIKVTPLSSSFDIPSVVSQDSSSSSYSLSGTEWEQEMKSWPQQRWEKEEQEEEEEEEQEQQQGEEQEQLWKDQKEPQDQQEEVSWQYEHSPILKEEEGDLAKVSYPKEAEPSQEHQLDETDRQVKESWQEGIKQEAKQPSAEKHKRVQKQKGPRWKASKSYLESDSSREFDQEKQLWYMQIQQQLQEEKQRLQEEQARLQEERQRLEEEEQYLEHWEKMFEGQREQWEREQWQREEQERLWQVQLEHWQHLQQENDKQEQFWWGQREQQQEQQCMLQEEVGRLEQECKEYLKLRGEQAEEQWRWSQLKEGYEKQQLLWQEEDVEQERKRCQWQEQRAQQEQQMEALREEQLEQERKYKQWQQEQEERQQELEHLWEKRWEQQMQLWHHQMHQQRAQVEKWQEQQNKLQERQEQIQKEEKPLAAKMKVVEGTILDQFAKQYKVSPTPKERHRSTTPQLSPIPSCEFDEDTFELETTWFPKLFSRAEEFPAPGVTEKRYWINVEAQRKNLEVLGQAVQKAGISSELYTKSKGLIKQALHSNVERLALLFRKYISFCHLQEARRSLLIQLEAAKDAKDGPKLQNLYKMVDNVDAYQKKVLEHWIVKQVIVEKKRRRCLERMIALFAQLRLSTKLQLTNPCPLLIKARESTKKEILHMPHIGPVFLKPRVYPSPLISVKKPQDFTFSAVVREPSSEQIESLWKTDITELSIPLGPKEPVSVLWSEACGFPDVPRFLELDISAIRKKPLQNIKTRIQNIPRWKISGYNFMHL